ncbi:MAG TPA: glycosyltransferase N-terminal domain-containing protein [Gammaproteobacteria bacterium]|jgi:3-deoxy-D-manno-octulosonic-acid transferase|nr:glycosyltransferase N-terminal domain-containing protein [Gammaproteobacteria bacterium]
MGFLLDVAYLLVFIVVSPWLIYRLATAGFGDVGRRFGLKLGPPARRSIWLHGSSAGEVALLRPLVALLERDFPDTPLVISAFTVTGLAAAARLYPRHRVVPLPFDLSFVVARCFRHFDPALVIVAESEFWPNFIAGARRRGTPVVLINGKMSAKSYRVHLRTGLIGRVLRMLDLLAVQTEEHAGRLHALGVDTARLRVTGNMKYDLARVATDRDQAQALRLALGYGPDDVVIIGGSLHEQEDDALLDAYAAARATGAPVALILVPRYPADAAGVEQRVQARGYAAVRKTAVDAGVQRAPGQGGVLVVDTVGELGKLYAVADLAFVGGSLFFRGANKGGHNLMEPAILAVPVLFGPYNFSFKETVEDLLAADAARLVRTPAELTAAVVSLVADSRTRRELGARAQRVVHAGQGATARNYALLVELLRARA